MFVYTLIQIICVYVFIYVTNMTENEINQTSSYKTLNSNKVLVDSHPWFLYCSNILFPKFQG